MTRQTSEHSPTLFTSISSFARAEWLMCWRCQDLLWVIFRVIKPHRWAHRHISPGFRSKQSAERGDRQLSPVQLWLQRIHRRFGTRHFTWDYKMPEEERAWRSELESPVQCPADVKGQPEVK